MFDAVAEAHVNLKEVAGEDRAGWSTLAHSDRVREVFSLAERAEAELIRTLSGWDLAGGRDPTTGIVTVTTPDGRTFSHRPTHLNRRP